MTWCLTLLLSADLLVVELPAQPLFMKFESKKRFMCEEKLF
jgi:hypothetical protein